MSYSKKYTDAEKIAYYKAKASGKPKGSGSRKTYSVKKTRTYRAPAAKSSGYVRRAPARRYVKGSSAIIKSGSGSIPVKKNSLVYNVDAVPEFSRSGRCTVVHHREFIDDIKSSTDFNISTYRINPGIENTFPWLSSIAANYEQYVVQGLMFEFKSTSAVAVASSTTTMGTVVMATQYNSLSPDFTSKQQMENYEGCQSTVPSQSILHAIECDPKETQCGGVFNVYSPTNVAGDRRLYDIGRFSIATVGMQDTESVLGELWVTYKICFLKPRLTGIDNVMDGYILQASSLDVTTPLGDLGTMLAYNTNSGFTSPNPTTSNHIDIDPSFVGIIQVTLYYHFSLAAITAWVLPTINIHGNGVNVTATLLGSSDIQTSVLPTAPNANKVGSVVSYFRVDGGYVQPGSIKTYIAVSSMTITTSSASPYFILGRIYINALPASFFLL